MSVVGAVHRINSDHAPIAYGKPVGRYDMLPCLHRNANKQWQKNRRGGHYEANEFSVLSANLVAGGIYTVDASESLTARYIRDVNMNAVQHYQAFEVLFRQFIQDVEENLQLRRDVNKLFARLDQKLKRDDYLSSEDKNALHENFSRYRKNIISLERYSDAFKAYSNDDLTFEFPATQPSAGQKKKGLVGLIGATEVHINPDDDLGRLMILELKMGLAAQLLLFDNFVVVLLPYVRNPILRRQINLDAAEPDAGFFLREVTNKFRDEEIYGRTLRVGDLVHRVLKYEKENPGSALAGDKDGSYFNVLIEGSYAYRRIPELTVFDRAAANFAAVKAALQDDIFNLNYKTTHEVSKRFGNTIGLYEERRGKLFNMPADEQLSVTDDLQLLDILLEKTPFRLTDRFIPGHWGHVAIWVGDSGDIPALKRLGVWDKLPRIEAEARKNLNYQGPSFQEMIEQDRGVLEALREGVKLNTFAHFLNIDDLAILRGAGLSDDQKKKYLLQAFAQIGKAYDFNFDIATHNKIVCSELAFVVYDDYPWPVEKNVGRYTISPDHIAALALKGDDPFAPLLIYHDGRRLPDVHHRQNFRRLMEGKYDQIVR